jgi:hypothetical protein
VNSRALGSKTKEAISTVADSTLFHWAYGQVEYGLRGERHRFGAGTSAFAQPLSAAGLEIMCVGRITPSVSGCWKKEFLLWRTSLKWRIAGRMRFMPSMCFNTSKMIA